MFYALQQKKCCLSFTGWCVQLFFYRPCNWITNVHIFSARINPEVYARLDECQNKKYARRAAVHPTIRLVQRGHAMPWNGTEQNRMHRQQLGNNSTCRRCFSNIFFLVIPFEQISSLLGVSPTCCAHFPRLEIDPFTLLFLAGFWFPSSTVDVVSFFLPSSRNIKNSWAFFCGGWNSSERYVEP